MERKQNLNCAASGNIQVPLLVILTPTVILYSVSGEVWRDLFYELGPRMSYPVHEIFAATSLQGTHVTDSKLSGDAKKLQENIDSQLGKFLEFHKSKLNDL